MSATAHKASFEGAIWRRIVRPECGDLTPAAAEALLRLSFDETDQARMHTLAELNREGRLTDGEQAELESYRRIGLQLDLLHAKARLVINGRP